MTIPPKLPVKPKPETVTVTIPNPPTQFIDGNGEPLEPKPTDEYWPSAKKPRKVAIIGKAPSSQMLAPYDDPSWEIWTLNNSAQLKQIPRWDRQFELHTRDLLQNPAYDGYYEWLCQKHDKPVYISSPNPDIPDGVVYPLDEIISSLGTRYFTNTVSYMIALAIHEGVEELGIWGVDMAQQGMGGKSEYAHQRPSCELFVGLALGRGIKVTIPPQSDLLFAPFMYGFESGDVELKRQTKVKELQGRIAHHQQQEAVHNDALQQWVGKLQVYQASGETDKTKECQEKISFHQFHTQTNRDQWNQLLGAMNMTQEYLTQYETPKPTWKTKEEPCLSA